MGTRSLTIIQNKIGLDVAVLYRQMDGYPSEHGRELLEFLKGKILISGFSNSDIGGNKFNGINCLAASIVAYFKKEIGMFYLHPANTRDCGEEYRYFVREGENGCIRLRIQAEESDKWRDIFDGKVDDCNEEEFLK